MGRRLFDSLSLSQFYQIYAKTALLVIMLKAFVITNTCIIRLIFDSKGGNKKFVHLFKKRTVFLVHAKTAMSIFGRCPETIKYICSNNRMF